MSVFLRRRKAKPETATYAIYYASDVHGSDLCWRKFLGAARFYGVQALVMGGDLTGKAIVPIERGADGSFSTTFLGERRAGRTEEELEQLREAVRFNGMYPWIASAEEIARCRDDAAARGELFERVMIAELSRWIDLADERMAAYGVEVFVMPGNDDPWSCDAVIESAAHVRACAERIVRVGPYEMVSCAWANTTPWASPREEDDDALYERLKALVEQLEDPANAIFNLHVPPYGSGLDTANEINPDLTLVYRGGQPSPIPVGSSAVRRIIEEVQPMLAFHGHIHESKGEARIGRTLCLNPGSEYNSGHIHGALVTLGGGEVLQHQFVAG